MPALTTAAPAPLVDAEQMTRAHLDELRAWAQIVHEFHVDVTTYVYERERLDRLRGQGRIPIVCVDDIDAVPAFERESGGWLAVLLWCPRDEALQRLDRRRSDVPRRPWRRRWERSSKGLLREARRFTLTLRSDHLDAVEAARIVHLAAQAGAADGDDAQTHGATVTGTR